MTIRRETIVDAIEIRPLMRQVGVTKCVNTYEDDELVATDIMTQHFSEGDDLSSEDALVQTIANQYWSM